MSRRPRAIVVHVFLVLFFSLTVSSSHLGSSLLPPFGDNSLVEIQDNCSCFNCLLPADECTQFGTCNQFTGLCNCPTGFGGPDCKDPLCGSLAQGDKRSPRGESGKCDCDDGWEGINCNLCNTDQACGPLMPKGLNGTCYHGAMFVNQNFQMCNVTNRKILDILNGKLPQVTFSCTRKSGECNFQFWIDETESFYCGLNGCDFDTEYKQDTNITNYRCSDIECSCLPGRMLCGEAGSIDLTDFLSEAIKGPGFFSCDSKKDQCIFSEPSMNQLIKAVFGDPSISLECLASECLYYTEVPGYTPPENKLSKSFIAILVGAGVAVLLFILLLIFIGVRKSSYDTLPSALPDSQESSKLMTGFSPANLSFRSVGYEVNGQRILYNVTGVARPGELSAIMGGSGAGKTTLLDILARKNKAGIVTGNIFVNGREVEANEFRNIIGFVDQDDNLMPTLTVYETILTSALLRLPRSMSIEAKKSRVLETMTELGIANIRDKLIGSDEARGISGGEKRRVAIACELVTSPSILFLDEPTSGLDSYNAIKVISCLSVLAKKFGRTVVFTIHQPRANIVSRFDNLILLARGETVYSGNYKQCATFFEDEGHACPPNTNIADYLVDLTMSSEYILVAESNTENRNGNGNEESEDHDEEHSDASSSQRRQETQLDKLIKMYNESSIKKELDRQIELQIQTSMDAQHTQDLARVFSTDKALIPQQFMILSRRVFKNLYRNPLLMTSHYIISICIAILCGLLYYHLSNDISGFQNRLGLFFFILALFGFSTLTTMGIFAAERPVFVRERANGYYSPISYFAAKVLFDIIPLRVFPPLILGLILYPLAGLTTSDPSCIGKFLLVLVLFNLTAASLCLFIGIIIKDSSVAILVGILVMLFSLLFAGLFLNHDTIPKEFLGFQTISIFHYAFEALVVNEVTYLTLIENKFGLSIEVPGATILSTFGFDAGAFWHDTLGLVIIFATFIILSYVAIHFYLIERR